MKTPLILIPLLFFALLGLLLWHPWRTDAAPITPAIIKNAEPAPAADEIRAEPEPEPVYTTGPASPDGTGKFYMGREIAQVMGHQAIDWLERSSRESEEAPSAAMRSLDFAPDATIADIGAGSGYYSFRLAQLVPDGKVIAIDIQPEMIAYLESRAADREIENVVAHLGTIKDTGLSPESIDAALMVDAYHEFSHPREMMESIVTALRPGGRVILLEYRAEDPLVEIKPLHKMTEAQARREMEAVGLEWVATEDFLPWQHLMIFEKPEA